MADVVLKASLVKLRISPMSLMLQMAMDVEGTANRVWLTLHATANTGLCKVRDPSSAHGGLHLKNILQGLQVHRVEYCMPADLGPGLRTRFPAYPWVLSGCYLCGSVIPQAIRYTGKCNNCGSFYAV